MVVIRLACENTLVLGWSHALTKLWEFYKDQRSFRPTVRGVPEV